VERPVADVVKKPAEVLTEQVKNMLRPPAMLVQSAGNGLAKRYVEAAECSTQFARENADELNRYVQEVLAARNSFGILSCYGNFLPKWGNKRRTIYRNSEDHGSYRNVDYDCTGRWQPSLRSRWCVPKIEVRAAGLRVL